MRSSSYLAFVALAMTCTVNANGGIAVGPTLNKVESAAGGVVQNVNNHLKKRDEFVPDQHLPRSKRALPGVNLNGVTKPLNGVTGAVPHLKRDLPINLNGVTKPLNGVSGAVPHLKRGLPVNLNGVTKPLNGVPGAVPHLECVRADRSRGRDPHRVPPRSVRPPGPLLRHGVDPQRPWP